MFCIFSSNTILADAAIRRLDSNQIVSILPGVFAELGSLTTLYVLSSVSAPVTVTDATLTRRYLDSNQITLLEPGVFHGLDNLASL
jgi:hypothetical protein